MMHLASGTALDELAAAVIDKVKEACDAAAADVKRELDDAKAFLAWAWAFLTWAFLTWAWASPGFLGGACVMWVIKCHLLLVLLFRYFCGICRFDMLNQCAILRCDGHNSTPRLQAIHAAEARFFGDVFLFIY